MAAKSTHRIILVLGQCRECLHRWKYSLPRLVGGSSSLKLGAQGGTALFVFQQIEDPPGPFSSARGRRWFTLNRRGAVLSYPTWLKVFDLCLITRQSHLSDEICAISNDVF